VPTIEANGLYLYYEERGEGVPIVCIHGTSSSALVWERDVNEIAKHGRCITYDRRGCFRSERPDPYDTTWVTDHGDDVAALLDALDAAPAVIIGRSYGGGVALDLARRYPHKVVAMALLEPAILTLDNEATEWSDSFSQRILEIASVDPSATAQAFLTEVVGEEAWMSFPDELKQMFIGNGPAIAAELRGGDLDISMEELQSIAHKALVVSAEESPEPFRRVDAVLVDALPNGEHAWVEGGHLISPAHPKVMEFVDRVLASTRHI
jgi:esterase